MSTLTPFVTAEEITSPQRGVWVQLETVCVLVNGKAQPHEFIITTSTGYRAVLPACGCGIPENCIKTLDRRHQHSGMSVKRWCEHIRTHCHAWHLPKAQQLAAQVSKTYGSAKR